MRTEIGYFVIRVWVTEAIRPGIVACSHHLGRWRLAKDTGGDRWSTALADLQQVEPGKWRLRQVKGIAPFSSADPGSDRVWKDAGVHQNLTFPVHSDPISGMHCWHQKVMVEVAGAEDRYGEHDHGADHIRTTVSVGDIQTSALVVFVLACPPPGYSCLRAVMRPDPNPSRCLPLTVT